MKIKAGVPVTDKNKEQELLNTGWKKTAISSDLNMLIIKSVPLMALGALIPFIVISSNGILDVTISNSSLIIGILIGMILHELLHIVVFPKFYKAKNLTMGIYSGGTYTFSDEIMSKARYCLMLMMPFITWSLLLPLFSALFHVISPIILVIAVFNGIASSLDIFTSLSILFKVPSNVTIATSGMEVYFYPKKR